MIDTMDIANVIDLDIARFWDKVNIRNTDQCWPWKASTRGRGDNIYGQFKLNDKMFQSHRISWYLSNGDIPKGKLICHNCDNSLCCNPSHLYCGTQKDNIQDRSRRNRVDCSVYAHSMSLYSGEIWLVRKLYVAGIKQKDIAKMFKTSQPTISTVLRSNKYIGKDRVYA